jgi:hypothetical protein
MVMLSDACAQHGLPFMLTSILPPVYHPLPPLENSRGSAVSVFPQICDGVGGARRSASPHSRAQKRHAHS